MVLPDWHAAGTPRHGPADMRRFFDVGAGAETPSARPPDPGP